MGKEKRPYQDDTIVFPSLRQIYSACYMGHVSGDPHEEPVKYTQALNEIIFYEGHTEWVSRLGENTIGADKLLSGQLEKEIEATKKLDALMSEMGVEEMIGEMETEEGIETVEKGIELVDETALEAIDEILEVDMFTSYGFHPPIVNLPIRLSPAVLVLLMGPSVDSFYNTIDVFSMENIPYLENWHYEEGIQTARTSLFYEHADDILERRHMRTGEKFRYLCVHRPTGEGEMMCVDIMRDIRNEVTPEYANSATFGFAYPVQWTPDCQSSTRSLWDMLVSMIDGAIVPTSLGWPFIPYVGWIPRPGLISMVQELPIDLILPRLVGILSGVNFWLSKYNMTHLETTHEVIGQEMITPTTLESSSSYIKYGMDRIRYPPSMVQSKRVYGQEAQMRPPTEYPLPENSIMAIDEAAEEIERARKEHPEWLTSVKGFGC
ncbi:MAG: hypothetical protein SVM80_09980 [Halobacteriota archaeon]|nr:hypothetical protein [Halobacteriota archaeon]